MKIVYVSKSVIPSRTANSVHVMRMCQAFADLGHDVTLLAQVNVKLEEENVDDPYSYYGVKDNFKLLKLYVPNIKFLKRALYSVRCFLEIRKINPDFVYGRGDFRALSMSLRGGFKTGLELHIPPEKKMEIKYISNILRHALGSKLVVISEALAHECINDLPVSSENILVAHDGADLIEDKSTPSSVTLNPNRKHIGYVGSLFKGRGIDTIFAMAKHFDQCDFHVIGGDEKDITYWKSHCDLKNILFYGFVSPKEAYQYRNMCDVLLAPYQTANEGNRTSRYMSPIKLFEYMSSAKPIICSDLPVIHEIFNERNALLVDPLDYKKWIDALQTLLDEPDYAQALANQAFEDFKTHYTWLARAKAIVEFMYRSESKH